MNSLIASLNQWAENVLSFCWPMLCQSSLLILVLCGLDLALKRKLRPAVRYALWLVVLVKLILPPSLALPFGVGWWVQPQASADEASANPPGMVTVTYGSAARSVTPATVRKPEVIRAALPSLNLIVVTGSAAVSLALLTLILIRWREVAAQVSKSKTSPAWLDELLEQCRTDAGFNGKVRLRVIDRAMSPAVCGIINPAILLPRQLLYGLSREQLRLVLMHELIHLRRGDVWVNCAQTLFQIVYWWHPLLWLANARIRRLREEAVDDTIMVKLGREASGYAPTLVHVARFALERPMSTLGLVGILEAPGSLRQRIERLLDFHPPRRTGLSAMSLLCVLGFAAVAVPMAPAPADLAARDEGSSYGESLWPDPRFSGYKAIKFEPRFLIVEETGLRAQTPSLLHRSLPVIFTSNELASLELKLGWARARPHNPLQPVAFEQFSGGTFHWQISRSVSNQVNYSTHEIDGKTMVTGANATFEATDPYWQPLELTLAPRLIETGVLCRIRLETGSAPALTQEAEVLIPRNGAAVWAIRSAASSHSYQLVILQESPVEPADEAAASAQTNAGSPLLAKNEAEASPETNRLYTRIFKVDPIAFSQRLGVPAGADPHTRSNAVLSIKEFFRSLGVTTPPKSVFYKDREGLLLVRGTLADLAAVERAVFQPDLLPPQVNVKIKLVALPTESAEPFFGGMTNDSMRAFVLDAPRVRVIWQAMENRKGVRLINEASVTTLSDRQTQFQFMMPDGPLTNSEPESGLGSVGRLITNRVPSATFDVHPVVASNGRTFQLTASAEITEFLGYDEPINIYQFGPQLPVPSFRAREIPAQAATLEDGQTLVLYSAAPSDSSGSGKTDFVAFFTPTIIDPAGNRVHPEGKATENNTNPRGELLAVPELVHPTLPAKPARR